MRGVGFGPTTVATVLQLASVTGSELGTNAFDLFGRQRREKVVLELSGIAPLDPRIAIGWERGPQGVLQISDCSI
jgi:hypothetical protein